MKKTFFVSLCFIFSVIAFGQTFELGKLSSSELEQNVYPQDTSAAAAVTFNKARTYFKYDNKKGFVAYTEFEIRIKVYKTEGLKWANFEVPYYVGWENIDPDHIAFSNAVTYNLVNGKIEKTKLDNQGTFKESINKFWKQKSIVMPNVKVGSVFEFKYVHRSENIVRLQDFKFQYDIPVQYSEYITEIPDVYVYNEIIKGYLKVDSQKVSEYKIQTFNNEYGGTGSLKYNQIKTVHKISNVPKLKEEDFVNNIENYRCVLQQELQRIRRVDQPDKKYAQTWEDVAREVFKSADFGEQLETRNYFEADLKPIISGLNTQQEKCDAVFKFAKNKLKWNGGLSAYTQEGVKKAYLNRSGNIAEVNFILISMLNYAGIQAFPVVLSTRKNGVSYFPNRTAFNYVIAAVEIDGKRLLLDASEEYSDINIVPFRALNWVGRLIRANGENEEIELTPKNTSLSSSNLIYKVLNDGSVNGKFRYQSQNYLAFQFRERFANLNRTQYLEKLEDDNNGIEISDYKLENERELKKPIIETFAFTSSNHIEIIGDRMFLRPMLYLGTHINPFRQEKREYPVEFSFPEERRYIINVEIPDGYVIESIPESVNLAMANQQLTFKYSISSQLVNKIQLSVVFLSKTVAIDPSDYQAVKDFFQKMVDKENEKIVLKKV